MTMYRLPLITPRLHVGHVLPLKTRASTKVRMSETRHIVPQLAERKIHAIDHEFLSIATNPDRKENTHTQSLHACQ